MCPSKLRSLSRGFRKGMHFNQREIPKNEPQVIAKMVLYAFDYVICTPAVRALIVAIFHQRNRRVFFPLNVIVFIHRNLQLCHTISCNSKLVVTVFLSHLGSAVRSCRAHAPAPAAHVPYLLPPAEKRPRLEPAAALPQPHVRADRIHVVQRRRHTRSRGCPAASA